MLRTSGLAALLVLLCPPCQAAGPVATASPSPSPSTPAKARVKLTPAEADQIVKEMSATVEKIRGQRFKTPVTMQIIDGARAREHFKSKILPRDEEQMKYTQQVYHRLGLIPKDTDLLTNYLNLAEEGVDGYYEPGTKTFYLLDHVSPGDIRAVIAHELTHALDDQHYDLQALSKLAGGDDDRSTAIAALVEGSAMVVMFTYMEQQRSKGQTSSAKDAQVDQARRAEKLKVAPSFTQRSLMLPYILGFSFMLRGHPWNFFRGGMPMSDLDYAFAHPPLSTRHIIHPDLYWLRPNIKFTPPKLADLSRQLGPGWTKATEGSIGELGLAVFTGARTDFDRPEVLLPESWSNAISAGTIGDCFQLYVNGDQRFTVFVTGWQSEAKAQAFARTLPPQNERRVYFRYGVNHLVLMGDFGDVEKAQLLAITALQDATYWPHDEGVGKWPPDRGPDYYIE
jgi:hypothetical protein